VIERQHEAGGDAHGIADYMSAGHSIMIEDRYRIVGQVG
jgi:hypothetical protein